MTLTRPWWLRCEEWPSATFDVPPPTNEHRSQEWWDGYYTALRETRGIRERAHQARLKAERRACERSHDTFLCWAVAILCVAACIAVVYLAAR